MDPERYVVYGIRRAGPTIHRKAHNRFPPPPLRVLLRVHRQSEVLSTLAPTEHVVQIWNGLESGAGSESCRVSGGLSLYCKSS